MKNAHDVIIAPVITERSMDMVADKRYTFKVANDANKPEIAAAVEELFGVKVACVNTINMKKYERYFATIDNAIKKYEEAMI